MARDSFVRVMGQMKDEVLILGSMVEEAILNAVNSLVRRDPLTARIVYQNDQNINEKRYAIENAVLIQMATQQPMAHDLRSLAAILEIINELERMGDYAKGIAKVTLLLEDEFIPIPAADLNIMANLGVGMLHRGLAAFVQDDPDAAYQIASEDNIVDGLYRQVYQRLVSAMILDPAIIDPSNYLMWVAHNLERLADRVVNICERTIFTCTGELFELDIENEEGMILR